MHQWNIMGAFTLWVLVLLAQFSVLKLELYMVVVFTVITAVLALITAAVFITERYSHRFVGNKKRYLMVIVAVIVLMTCPVGLVPLILNVETENACSHPEYLAYGWAINFIALSATLKCFYIVKLVLTIILLALYIVVISCYRQQFLPDASLISVIHFYFYMALIFVLLYYRARLVELTTRLYYLWKQKTEVELNGMEAIRETNMQLLANLLPDYVAQHFLMHEYKNEELYSQSRDGIGVLFASIPNFINFYSEEKSLECLRLLNEITVDFDELLGEKRFRCIEKIKTISATTTYMAVSGLTPTAKKSLVAAEHFGTLIDFALAMRQKLEDINRDSFNNFQLRVGVSYGNLVCGVIGAKKPVFDVWGDTVNEASRMESTGINGQIQVPQNLAKLLVDQGYKVKLRGTVNVRGKGYMETCFVLGKKLKKVRSCERYFRHDTSLEAVVQTIAKNRKRFMSYSYRF